jgi:hypothetical protein
MANYPADYVTAQSAQNAKPYTVASAASITPLHKFVFVTGTVTVATIPPPDPNGYCEVTLCFTNASPGVFLTSGNLQIAYQPVQNRPIDLCYDPATKKWWVKAVV